MPSLWRQEVLPLRKKSRIMQSRWIKGIWWWYDKQFHKAMEALCETVSQSAFRTLLKSGNENTPLLQTRSVGAQEMPTREADKRHGSFSPRKGSAPSFQVIMCSGWTTWNYKAWFASGTVGERDNEAPFICQIYSFRKPDRKTHIEFLVNVGLSMMCYTFAKE